MADQASAVAQPASAPAHHTADPLAPGPYRVGVADYTLGDSAFSVRNFCKTPGDGQVCSVAGRAPIELTGRVWYPSSAPAGRHPMVIMLHGSWITCADRDAGLLADQAIALENAWDAAHPGNKLHPGAPNPHQAALDKISGTAYAKMTQWPCARGTSPLPSYLGYDYLGQALASYGITTVSISANGINAVGLGDIAVKARAALINKHLAMWAELDRTGRGPLAGHFTLPGTKVSVQPNFRDTIDLTHVGTLGHSRGGKAVFYQAADVHRAQWPHGVQVAAMVSLAPEGAIEVTPGTPDMANYAVNRVPFLLWGGTCDQATGTSGDDYVTFTKGTNRVTDYKLLVYGANHNFLNQQWSPSSGQVEAADDNDTLGLPRADPGRCGDGADSFNPRAQPELSEAAERATSTAYVVAFFLRELSGQTKWQPILQGAVKPLGHSVHIDVRAIHKR